MEEIIQSGWQDFCDGLVKIFNTPTCIAGVTIGSILIFCLVLFTKTSLGKKAFKKLRALLKESNDKLVEARNELVEVKKEFDAYKENKEAEIKEIKDTYEVYIVGAKQETKKVEDLLLAISENIHNGKVQKEVNDYLEAKKDYVEDNVSAIVETAKEEARSEYQKELDDLKAQLDEVKGIINEGAEIVQEEVKEVVDYGENNITNI